MLDPKTRYIKNTPTSAKFWRQASKVIPGGITANVKFFDPYPLFMKKARGQEYLMRMATSTLTTVSVSVH